MFPSPFHQCQTCARATAGVLTAGASRREVEALEEKLEEAARAKAEAQAEAVRAKAEAQADAARATAEAQAEAARAKAVADTLRADLARLREQAQNQSACCGVS